MEKEKNIELLIQALTAAGFPASLEWNIRVQLCFKPAQFTLSYLQHIQGDVVKYSICIRRDKESEAYYPAYYDACLRKRYELPNIVVGEINLADLDKQMMLINWRGLAQPKAPATVGDMADLELVSSIIGALDQLSSLPDGAKYADGVKTKYWLDTPFEPFIDRLGGSKSELEVCQRFHFFEEGQGITSDEAYRFLCHRWFEKQVASKKKELSATTSNRLSDDKSGKRQNSMQDASTRIKSNLESNERQHLW